MLSTRLSTIIGGVEELLAEFEASRSPPTAMMICEELERHMVAEEAGVYPVIAEEISEEMAEHAEQEHGEAKELITRIRRSKDPDVMYELVGLLRDRSSSACGGGRDRDAAEGPQGAARRRTPGAG
jgi:hemerythrin HHE cation binding domain-containing protein